MDKKKINELLAQLHRELENSEVDSKTALLVKQLQDDVHKTLDTHQLTNPISAKPAPSLIEQAKKLEVKFATEHPVSERIIQEIIDMLSKMGI